MKNFIRVLAVAIMTLTLLINSADAAEKILSIGDWQKQCTELETKQNYDKAAELYTKAINQYPTYTNFFVRRGEVYLHLGKTDKAAADFKRALLFDDKC
ncbi:MAG: tetratricopeptide repeat protein, partial [Selenomonadaceae bacterium]|nr:tetratricopeptide repeat protein [Selenomonadaceae bacterium]